MERLMKRTMICSIVLAVLMILGTFLYAENRKIVIRNVSMNMDSREVQKKLRANLTELKLTENGEKNTISIDLPEGILAENISVHNEYLQKAFVIKFSGVKSGSFRNQEIPVDSELVSEGYFYGKGDEVSLLFMLQDIMQYEILLDKKTLQIQFSKPTAGTEIVLIETVALAGEYEAQSKEILEAIAYEVETKLNEAELGVYVLDTAIESSNKGQVQKMLQDTGATRYLRLECGTSTDQSCYGLEAVVNADFFNPDVPNVWMAEKMLIEAATAVNNRADKLEKDETGMLNDYDVPATIFRVGYLTNEKEGQLLQEEGYQKLLGDAIAKALSTPKDEKG